MAFIRLAFEGVWKVTLGMVFVITDFCILVGVVQFLSERYKEWKIKRNEKKMQNVFRKK